MKKLDFDMGLSILDNLSNFLRGYAEIASCWRLNHPVYPNGTASITIELNTGGFRVRALRNLHNMMGYTETKFILVSFKMAFNDPDLIVGHIRKLATEFEMRPDEDLMQYYKIDRTEID